MEKEPLKIIDFKRKGNMIRFALGKKSLTEWGGDDWNDTPYEHNAEDVYDEYVTAYKYVVFDFDDIVMEPSEGHINSVYSKDDMIKRNVPCLVVLRKKDQQDNEYYESFEEVMNIAASIKYYFGDEVL